jgi:Flp pilus assembly protein CpaB
MTVMAATRRRLRRPALDGRVIGGVVLVALSVIGGLRLGAAPTPAARVWVATSDLDAGHVITSVDLRPADVRADGALVGGLSRVAAGRPVGRILRVQLRSGAPLPIDGLAGAATNGREITVPVTPEHALGGDLRAGDRVDVVATFDRGTDVARTRVMTRAAVVRGVVRSDGLFGQREGGLTALTLLADPDDALALVFAARNAELDIVRARGNLDGAGAERVDGESLR